MVPCNHCISPPNYLIVILINNYAILIIITISITFPLVKVTFPLVKARLKIFGGKIDACRYCVLETTNYLSLERHLCVITVAIQRHLHLSYIVKTMAKCYRICTNRKTNSNEEELKVRMTTGTIQSGLKI